MAQNESESYQQYIDDDAYCTEYVKLPRNEKGQFCFAFVCPKCEHENKLKGNPLGFRNRTFSCHECRWVPLLKDEAIDRFIEGLEVDD